MYQLYYPLYQLWEGHFKPAHFSFPKKVIRSKIWMPLSLPMFRLSQQVSWNPILFVCKFLQNFADRRAGPIANSKEAHSMFRLHWDQFVIPTFR